MKETNEIIKDFKEGKETLRNLISNDIDIEDMDEVEFKGFKLLFKTLDDYIDLLEIFASKIEADSRRLEDIEKNLKYITAMLEERK